MPNYRNRNKNRNKNNKNRSKQNSNYQQNKKQQQDCGESQPKNPTEKVASLGVPPISEQTENVKVISRNHNESLEDGTRSHNATPLSHEENAAPCRVTTPTETAIASKSNEENLYRSVEILTKESPPVKAKEASTESFTESDQKATHAMGGNSTKESIVGAVPGKQVDLPGIPESPRQPKVIAHRIAGNSDQQQDELHKTPSKSPPLQRSARVIIHTIHIDHSSDAKTPLSSNKTQSSGVEAINNDVGRTGTISPPPCYTVESPKNLFDKSVADFKNLISDIQIQEMSESNSGLFVVGDNVPLVSEVETDTEPRGSPKKDDVPLVSEVEADTEPPDSPSKDVVSSLTPPTNTQSQQDDFKLKRAQKRSALETHFLPQLLSPRYLDSILEENSDMGSEYSLSRSSSANVDEKLEASTRQLKKAFEAFPKSQLDFSRSHKQMRMPPAYVADNAIREEPTALIFETKLIEPVILPTESYSQVASTLVPESEDAELVYLSSSASSSISDLMELELERAAALAERTLVDLDTDANALIMNPVKLAASPVPTNNVPATITSAIVDECESRESTPVNQVYSVSGDSPFSSSPSVATQASTQTAMPTFTTIVPPTPANAAKIEVSKFEGEFKLSEISGTKSAIAEDDAKHFETIFSANENSATADGFSLSAADNNEATSLPTTSSVSEVTEFLNAMDKMRELVETSKRKNKVVSANDTRESPSPPPIPPPPSITDYDLNIVPQLQSTITSTPKTTSTEEQTINQRKLLTKTTEANANSDNINNIFHPTSSNNNLNQLLKRQESADSYCSDSTQYSQCTAIQVPSPPQSATPTLLSSQLSNQKTQSNFDGSQPFSDAADSSADPCAIKKLRLLCTETLASMPYGEDVLEELAHVAQNISEVRAKQNQNEGDKMPYPLPDLPHINELQLSLAAKSPTNKSTDSNATLGGNLPAHTVAITQLPLAQLSKYSNSPPTPSVPVQTRKYEDAGIGRTSPALKSNTWLGLPISVDPKFLVCLSPAQQALIDEQQQAEFNKPDQLLDAHKRFIERRGYYELSDDQVRAINNEKLEEQKILKTAAIMKQLRKGLTPSPPPVPPPPVPIKSLETVAKANCARQYEDAKSFVLNDVIGRNANKNGKAVEKSNQQNNNDIDNRHRLLEIIQHGGDVQRNESHINERTSSDENNSRGTADEQRYKREPPALPQRSSAKTEQITDYCKHFTSGPNKSENNMDATTNTRSLYMSNPKFPESTYIQDAENGFSRIFPSIGKPNLFDGELKRFSNIESSSTSRGNNEFCSPLLNTQPKRYSNIETSTLETKKLVENGHVVYDFSSESREKQEDGVKSTGYSYLHNNDQPSRMVYIPITKEENCKDETDCKSAPTPAPPVPPPPAPELFDNGYNTKQQIMSTLNLNADNTADKNVNKNEQTEHIANINSLLQSEREKVETLKQNGNNTYEQFRQNAKVAAEQAISTSVGDANADACVSEATSLSTANLKSVTSSTPLTTGSTRNFIDHEKLFKDFDELSKQLHVELESGKAQREERERSTSLFDLSQLQMGTKQFNELKHRRHEHMKELEREIERAKCARQQRMSMPRSFDIPIHLENGSSHSNPVHENQTKSQTHCTGLREDYRRAESMCNLSNLRPHTSLGQYNSQYFAQKPQEADWERFASHLGYSENIVKPFAREVEICYQRQHQPRQFSTIRAPRLSVSTNDLTASTLHSFDAYNAYGARRSHAPMLSQVPQQQRPHFSSCYSMIERNPNPTYISTTSRRGISPVPQPQSHQSQQQRSHCDRRASLPRELHEKQLKYISSKEEELQKEFERLQNERRRLMNDVSREATQLTPTHSQRRDSYRPVVPKLPTLTEDEVFRQQMAEEWLNKVAEREERRLQKIIKISKIHKDDHATSSIAGKSNISDEFLDRVKERRTKLSIPADSDWESGAESRPYAQGQASESDAETQPMKIIEGHLEANLRQLPRHLREFAKLSNHETQHFDGGQKEIHEEEQFRQEANDNSLSSAREKSSIIKTYKVSRLPPSVQKTNNNQAKNTDIESEYEKKNCNRRNLTGNQN